jgi:CRP/FNR family transcriptional regulator
MFTELPAVVLGGGELMPEQCLLCDRRQSHQQLCESRVLRDGQTLFREGSDADHVYLVLGGTLRLSIMLPDGREQVCSFAMADSLVGLDGLALQHYGTTARALGDVRICCIAYPRLTRAMANSATVQQAFNSMMSAEVVRNRNHLVILALQSAQARVAAFVLQQYARRKALGWPELEFTLAMPRGDIASFLGLTIESVSRAFSAFQRQGLFRADGRMISEIDIEGLRKACMAGGSTKPAADPVQ